MKNFSEADRQFVEQCVMSGMTIVEIAEALNCSDDTIRRRFRYELMTARARLKGKAIKVLVDQLDDGSLEAAKFVLARQAGWTERSITDHQSSDGSMSPVQTFADLYANPPAKPKKPGNAGPA